MFEPLDSKTSIPRALGHLEVSNYILDQLISELRELPKSDHMAQDMALCRAKAHLNSLLLRMEWLSTAVSGAPSAVKLFDPLIQFLDRTEGLRVAVVATLPNLRGSAEPHKNMEKLSAVELAVYAYQAFHQMKENLEGIRRYMNVLSGEQIDAACARLRGQIGTLSGDGRADAQGGPGGGSKLTGTDS